MSGEDTVPTEIHGEQEIAPAEVEGSSGVENIVFNMYLGETNKWPDSSNKPWYICWNFQSKGGCRNGVHCKWVHDSRPTYNNSYHEQQSRWEDRWNHREERYRYGRRWGRDSHYDQHYGSMEGSSAYQVEPRPTTCIDAVTQNFVLNVKSNDFSPVMSPKVEEGTKDLYFWSSKKSCKRSDYESKRSEPVTTKLTFKSQVASFSLTPTDMKKGGSALERCTVVQQDISEKPNSAKIGKSDDDSDIMKTPMQKPAESAALKDNEENQITSQSPSCDSESTRLNTPPNMTALKKTPIQNSPKNLNFNSSSGKTSKSSMFMRRRNKSRSSQQSLNDWSEFSERSPMNTPSFMKLPMPPLDSNGEAQEKGNTSPELGQKEDTVIPILKPKDNQCFSTPKKTSEMVTERNVNGHNTPQNSNWKKCSERLAQFRFLQKCSSKNKGRLVAGSKMIPSIPESFRMPYIPEPSGGSLHHDHNLLMMEVSDFGGKRQTIDQVYQPGLQQNQLRGRSECCLDFETVNPIINPTPGYDIAFNQNIAGQQIIHYTPIVEPYFKTPTQNSGSLVKLRTEGHTSQQAQTPQQVYSPPREVPDIILLEGRRRYSPSRSNLKIRGWNRWSPGQGLDITNRFPKRGEHYHVETNLSHGPAKSTPAKAVPRRGKPRSYSRALKDG